MTIVAQITELAEYAARTAQQRIPRLEREMLKLKTELAEKEAALAATRLMPKRLTKFSVTLGGHYQCPRCWIEHEVRATLHPVGSGPRADDKLSCGTCDLEVTA